MKRSILRIGTLIAASGTFPCAGAIVTNTGDSGPGSLRDAIAAAEPGETITFDPALEGGTITLGGSQLAIDASITIDASDLPGGVTIDAAGASRVLSVSASTYVTLSDLTLTGGNTSLLSGETGDGGAIHSEGYLSLTRCAVIANTTAPGPGHGGGIFSRGWLEAVECEISGNSTGGVYTLFGPYNAVPGNGGGVYNSGSAKIRDCTLAENATGGGMPFNSSTRNGADGGAVYNRGELSISGCIIARNSTGGGGLTSEGGKAYGLLAGGEGGSGGGLFNSGDSDGYGIDADGEPDRVRWHRSHRLPPQWRIGGDGGAMHNEGNLMVSGSTVTGNVTGEGGRGFQGSDEHGGAAGRGGNGGGVHNLGFLLVSQSTIAGNGTGSGGHSSRLVDGNRVESQAAAGAGAGIFNGRPTPFPGIPISFAAGLAIENSIVAGNNPPTDGATNVEGLGDVALYANNLLSGDPALAPLGYYGGPTPTLPPGPGSPAIDAGTGPEAMPGTDQRGFPRTVGAAPDLGAYESGSPAGYAAWAAENLSAGSDRSFSADADHDGLANGLAYGGVEIPVMVEQRGVLPTEIVFGYQAKSELDLARTVSRSTDLVEFTEILRIERGEITPREPGVSAVLADSRASVTDPGATPAAFYRVTAQLVP